MTVLKASEMLFRVGAHSKTNTKETNVDNDRIEPKEQEAHLSTADLARSAGDAEIAERKQANRREDTVLDNRTLAAQASDEIRTNVSAAGRAAPGTAGTATAAAPARDVDYARLFSESDAKGFRARWENLQVSFVDEPRRAVEQADSLVAETIKRLAEVFADERQKLEGQWDRGDNVSTEDLRLALQRYRAFFGRLLSV